MWLCHSFHPPSIECQFIRLEVTVASTAVLVLQSYFCHGSVEYWENMKTEGSANAALWKSAINKLPQEAALCFSRCVSCVFDCSYFSCSTSAEVENAKWGLQGGQAHNISTIHPEWNPFSHPLCHSQCHALCQSPLLTSAEPQVSLMSLRCCFPFSSLNRKMRLIFRRRSNGRWFQLLLCSGRIQELVAAEFHTFPDHTWAQQSHPQHRHGRKRRQRRREMDLLWNSVFSAQVSHGPWLWIWHRWGNIFHFANADFIKTKTN